MRSNRFSQLNRLFAIFIFSYLLASCGEGDGPESVKAEACPFEGIVGFDADSYSNSSASATVLLNDACIAFKTVEVVVDNGTETISIDVELDIDGKGTTAIGFGVTSDETDTIAVSDGDVLTVTYNAANGVDQTDTADITGLASTLGVYSETNTNPVIAVGNINSDLGGKATTVDDSSTAVTAFDGSVSLQADFLSTGAGGDFNGFLFDFNPPLVNGKFEADDASAGNVPGATGWTTFEFVNTNNTAGPGFGPVSHDAGGTQSLTMFGPFTFDSASGAFQPDDSVVAGSVYTATAHAMNWNGDNLAADNLGIFQLSFWDAPGGQNGGGAQLSVREIIVDSTNDATNVYLPPQDGADISDWSALSITEIAPAGTQSAEIFLLHIQLNTPAAGGSIFWDDVSLVKGATSGAELGSDVSSLEVLRFAFNASASAGLMDLEIKLEDTAAGASSVFLSNYTGTPSPITGWDVYDIPLVDFPAGVDLTRIISLGYFNPSSTVTGSTSVAPTLFDTTLYFDDVHFATGAATGPTVLTGTLVNSAVQGVTYQTATQSGVTNALGEFNYLAGEMITFSIGGIVIGVVEGASLITPVELTGSIDPTDDLATNVLVLLQSLDSDADHSNGITISAATRTAAVAQTLVFTEPDFTAQITAVVTAIEDPADPVKGVIAENTALDNFYTTYVSIGGTDTVTWLFPGYPPVPEVTTFALVWSDEFDVAGVPDASNWTMETGYGSNGWGNNEWQLYTASPDNVKVEGGNLVITADCPTAPCGVRDGTITSARINTLNSFSFKYGKVEARIQMPVGEGAWPAFWMLGANFPDVGWPNAGEIDISEVHNFFSDANTTHFTIHYCDDFVSSPCTFDPGWTFTSEFLTTASSLGDGFHVYSAEWDENEIVGKIDGTEYFRRTINPANMDEFLKEFFMILNVAMGGTLGSNQQPPNGTETWPQIMLVDYVRVYQEVGGNGTFTIGADPLEPLGVYSETNTDPVIAYSEIIDSADLGGKVTVTNEASMAVTPLDGTNALAADFISTGAGGDYNGFVFNFGSPAGSGNLLMNEGFETPDASAGDSGACGGGTFGDWNYFNCNFVASNLFQPGGSFLSPGAHEGNQVLKQFGTDAGVFQTVSAAPGETFNASAYALSWSGDAFNNLGILQIFFLDSGGVNLSGGFNAAAQVIADTLGNEDYQLAAEDGGELTDWTLMEVSAVAPAGTAEAKIQMIHVLSSGQPAGGALWWDDISLTEGITAVPGTDISGYETLRFAINVSAAAGLQDLEVKMETSAGASASVFLSDYTPTAGSVAGWDVYEIALVDFDDPVAIDLTDIIFLGFWNGSSTITGATGVAPTLLDGTIYFDDIYFKLGLPPVVVVNELTNEGFETPDASTGDSGACGGGTFGDWNYFNCNFVASNLFQPGGSFLSPGAHEGSQVLKQFGTDAGVFQTVAASPGDTVDVSAYALSWSGDAFNNLAILQIFFLDSVGDNISGGFVAAAQVIADTLGNEDYQLVAEDGGELTDWTLMEVSAVAPAGTAEVKVQMIHVLSSGQPAGGAIWWDDVSLSIAP